MIYVYAITAQPEVRWPALRGLEEAPVFGLRYHDLAAAVSRVSTEAVPTTADNAWCHEKVVEGMMASRTVLPVRFGTVFGGERAVQDALTEHYDDLVADLHRLHGRVELGVRVLDDTGDEPPPPLRADPPPGDGERPAYGTGRAYLLARGEEERRQRSTREQAESLAAAVHAPLAHLSALSAHRVLATPHMLLTAAYLLDRGAVATFREEVEALGRDYPHLQFLCTGPWPPYSFVTTAAAMS